MRYVKLKNRFFFVNNYKKEQKAEEKKIVKPINEYILILLCLNVRFNLKKKKLKMW